MKTRKVLVIIALVAGLGFAGLQQASARGGWGGGFGNGPGYPCLGYGANYQMLDEATQAKIDTFRTNTTELRKQIAMKRAEKLALMNSQTPDAAAVAKVEGELFDLRTQMQNMAKEANVPMMGMGGRRSMGGGFGRGGQGFGNGPCFNPQVLN